MTTDRQQTDTTHSPAEFAAAEFAATDHALVESGILEFAPVEFRGALLGRLLRRPKVRSVRLGHAGLSFRLAGGASAGPEIDFGRLPLARVTRGLFCATVEVTDASGGHRSIRGLPNGSAEKFAAALAARTTLHASRERLPFVVSWADSHVELVSGARFISRHERDRWMEAWKDTAGWEDAHHGVIEEALPVLATRLRDVRRFWANHEIEVARANDAFARAETERHAPLFDDINGRSLTAQQREIAVRNDTDVLVIAGAGTGKTQAIAGKVAYLVRSGLAQPEEILIVAFNTKAAEELRERCGRVGGDGIQARTFHSLGNRILGAPPLVEGAGDDDALPDLLKELIRPLRGSPDFESDFSELVLLHREPVFPAVSCRDHREYVRSVKVPSLRPLRGGPRVKNGEELRIADWLYLHGIAYEYEKIHPPPPGRPQAPVYKTSFYLPRWEIWLAHHPLDGEGQLPPWFADRARHAAEIARGRAVHRACGTRLVESASWWFTEDDWAARLRNALAEAGAEVPAPRWDEARAGLADERQREIASRSECWLFGAAARYIQLLSEGGHDPEAVFSACGPRPDARRVLLFKRFCQPAWHAYQRWKGEAGRIDFSDMIRRAREAVAEGTFSGRFTHIIVDEFQDVSRSKLELLLALRRLTPGSHLTCVGDDWQAINRFAGGELGVMTGFARHVGGRPWETRLDATFRFSNAIAEVSGWFVQNNPEQITKQLSSNRAGGGDELVVIHAPHASPDDFTPILHALGEIDRRARPRASVCILSRYRRLLGDPEGLVASLAKKYPRLSISVSTVHKYKGKEADWVVVGWLTDERSGFPCLRLDDPIMTELLPESERFPFAEERRLFYVALTRGRLGVYLVCDQARPSPFVSEIEREWTGKGRIKVVNLGPAPNRPCPRCKDGALVPRSGPHGLFYACQSAPACDYREASCPACGIGMMLVEGDTLTCSDEACRHQVRRCPACGTGRLVERTNPATGERFLGCSMYSDRRVRCRFTTVEKSP